MKIRAAKKIKHAQNVWATTMPDLLVFFSILFYSMSILKTLTKPW